MWYSPPTQNEHGRVQPDEIVARVESDLDTIVSENVGSGACSLSAKALACSTPEMASTGLGSEYWLP